jgi:hypothetical protein
MGLLNILFILHSYGNIIYQIFNSNYFVGLCNSINEIVWISAEDLE